MTEIHVLVNGVFCTMQLLVFIDTFFLLSLSVTLPAVKSDFFLFLYVLNGRFSQHIYHISSTITNIKSINNPHHI